MKGDQPFMLRIDVAPHGSTYVAENKDHTIVATGLSAEEAAENGRLTAIAMNLHVASPMMIVKVNEVNEVKIVLQRVDAPVSFTYMPADGSATADGR